MLNLNSYQQGWGAHYPKGWTIEKACAVLARRKYVMLTEHWPITPEMLRRYNPDCKCYRVMNLGTKKGWETDIVRENPITRATIATGEWWLYDDDGNVRTAQDTDGIIYTDVTKPGYGKTYIGALLPRLKGWDGVVFEDCNNGGRYPEDAWREFLSAVSAAVRNAGYPVIGNCAGEYRYSAPGNNIEAQRACCNAITYEKWAVGWAGEYLPTAEIDARIESFRNDPMVCHVADMGLKAGIPDYDAKRRLSLAMYYCALPEGRESSYSYYGERGQLWDPYWDWEMGWPRPWGMAHDGPGRYARDYEHGQVALNYTDEPWTVDATLAWSNITGEIVFGEHTIPAHDALILRR